MILTFVIGTRPEFLKVQSVINELKKDNGIRIKLISTLQQEKLFFKATENFNIKIDYWLKASINKNMDFTFSKLMRDFSDLFKKIKTDIILVQGDTLTAYAASCYAFLNKITLVHLEAGLRTYNRNAPWPEEIFRQNIARFAELNLAQTKLAKENLIREKIDPSKIVVVGNPGIDTLVEESKSKGINHRKISNFIDLNNKILITMHRKESIKNSLKLFCENLQFVCKKNPNLNFIWPLHSNTQIINIVKTSFNNTKTKNLSFIEPLEYHDFIYILRKSVAVITDSGGVQEEAAYIGIPSLIARVNTERPEIIKLKLGKLVNANGEKLNEYLDFFLKNKLKKSNINSWRKIQGNGKSSKKIKKIIYSYFLNKKKLNT
ncbi:UDP-N-acetylglucosamine 2-epimerase (non-hydrolyzing) [Rickettsiales bacterium]|nr:UDP-N-acetylglucosamine 2-epimerase (non-hydrolyzing) [Rickettsiales bacterium]